MAGIKLDKSLSKLIEKQTRKQFETLAVQALENTAKDLEKLMKQFIQEYFYDAMPEGEVYKRTGHLLRSVTKTKITRVGNDFAITIYLDPNADPVYQGDYDNRGSQYVGIDGTTHQRFYINSLGKIVIPENYSQNYDAYSVFHLASQGIHGLPAYGESGWVNNRFKQTTPSFWDKFQEEIDTTDILRRYSDFIRRVGYNVVVS